MQIGQFNVIEPAAIIHDSVTIKHFNYIWKDVEIGEGTKIGSYCELEKGTKIGKNCNIQGRIRTGPHAIIEDDVVIKYGTIITDYATIKKNTFIGPNVITLGAEADRAKVYGTVIGENCFIGAGTKITAGIQICDDVIIGANSFVKKDITVPGIYVGTPVKKVR
jgi:UDP-3-O-[3-hydroxymyristoyl] glucosamine N-acyltransferase